MYSSLTKDLKHVKILIIDNYDSYTFNMLQLIQCEVVVIRNDQYTWQEFSTNILPHFDSVIISPGPGRPEREADFGICTPLLKAQLDQEQSQHHRPIFGICLGHQGIGYLLGGKVDYAPRIMHGRMSEIHAIKHNDDMVYGNIFHHCSIPFWAVRYHSLVIDPSSLPSCLILTAYCQENDADMNALKNSVFLSDDKHDDKSMNHRNHFLDHLPSSPSTQLKHHALTVMGFQHKTLPLWGVQFHPESVSTEHGQIMMDNFIMQTYEWMKKTGRPLMTKPLDSTIQSCSVTSTSKILPCPPTNTADATSAFTLHTKRCFPHWVDPEYLVEDLLNGDTVEGLKVKSISWLDSSRKSSPYSQISILSVDPALTVRYSTLHRQINIQDRHDKHTVEFLHNKDTFFDYISRWLESIGKVSARQISDKLQDINDDDDLSQAPLQTFLGGLTGYFGYEMKRESLDGYETPLEQQCHCTHHDEQPISKNMNCCNCMEEPDAAFHFIDRFWLFDHEQRQLYACGLVKNQQYNIFTNDQKWVPGFAGMDDLMGWIQTTERMILHTMENIRRRQMTNDFTNLTPSSSTCTTPIPKSMILDQAAPMGSDLFTANVQHDAYLQSIQQCVQQIKEGESYEICLTTRFRLTLPNDLDDDDDDNDMIDANTKIHKLWKLYTHHLRKNNPAPFSALIHFPGDQVLPAFGLLGSSPERFLKVENGVAEMKPIKGTMARALHCVCDPHECDFGPRCEQVKLEEDHRRKQKLWEDVKERAENLMIVDLIRNDLAQVCDPNTVQVPKLMHVETYEKVHHLVSTVRGTLQPNVNCVDALKKCFPPGSMTGAPKLRSVQLLDELEHYKRRGVYSGCLGYLSLNGSADFSVVIRTAVATSTSSGQVELSVGGGGAITFLSDPEQEWKETLLKTKSVAPSVKEYLEQQ
ncbi:ADC synthase [Halteromyces radiatus]|uniref:ADC synthase n=1 Tax=Halteromyces radiatus TaxID=101107 RepID=UPI002220016A|nr:ADC synthase [Halteromyces radiatus]KAI8098461.1 ADC synthase [Halteromyces radiatus]